jgi:hypothetical protein
MYIHQAKPTKFCTLEMIELLREINDFITLLSEMDRNSREK